MDLSHHTELDHAIKKLERDKIGGEDEVTGEMFQNLNEDTNLALFDNIINMNDILESEQFPEKWRHGLIIKVPKKGDLSDCNFWRISSW